MKYHFEKFNQGKTENFWHIAMLDIQVVGESGLFVPEDIALVREAGVGAVCLETFLCQRSQSSKSSGYFSRLSSCQCPFLSNGSEFSKSLLKALMFIYRRGGMY